MSHYTKGFFMFSAEFQYALLLLTKVREKQNLEPVTIEEVSMEYDIRKEFLFKVARKLRQGGYIKSIRGPGGGYIAARDLSVVSFWDLFQDIHLQNSLIKPATTNKKALKVIDEQYKAFTSVLSKYEI